MSCSDIHIHTIHIKSQIKLNTPTEAFFADCNRTWFKPFSALLLCLTGLCNTTAVIIPYIWMIQKVTYKCGS